MPCIGTYLRQDQNIIKEVIEGKLIGEKPRERPRIRLTDIVLKETAIPTYSE